MYGIFGSEITIYAVIYKYSVYTVFWAAKLPYMRSYINTVYIRYFWHGNHHTFIQSYTVHIHGSGQPYVHACYLCTLPSVTFVLTT